MKYLSLPIILLAVFLLTAVPSFAQSASLTATVRPNPLKVEITAPSNVGVGEWFDISAKITNFGTEIVTKTTVTLNSPRELRVRNKKKRLGNLASGETISLKWQVKAKSEGNFIVLVEASGRLEGEKISASDSRIITADDSIFLSLLRLIFGR